MNFTWCHLTGEKTLDNKKTNRLCMLLISHPANFGFSCYCKEQGANSMAKAHHLNNNKNNNLNNLGTCQWIYISQLFCSMQVLLNLIIISKWWSSKVADKALLFWLLHCCTCFIHGWKRIKYYKLKKDLFIFFLLLLLSHMGNTAVTFMITLSRIVWNDFL